MTKFPFPRPTRPVPVVAALVMFGAPALAQGTAAEREACTSDAVNLCSDTIPDIPKTTACMKAHLSQLTPRCRAVVAGRPDQPTSTRHARRDAPPDDAAATLRRHHRYTAPDADDTTDRGDAYGPRDADEMSGDRRYYGPPDGDTLESAPYLYGPSPDADEPGARRYMYVAPDGQEAEAPEPADRARARTRIGHLCDDDELDPETCALTERALRR